MSKMPIGKRVVMLVLLSIATLLVITMPYQYFHMKKFIIEEKQQYLLDVAGAAYQKFEEHYALYKEGKVTEEQAKIEALDEIKMLRYGREGLDYFWINDMHPTMIMHPVKPALNGTDITNMKDKVGNFMFQDMMKSLRASKTGYAFTQYFWALPNDPNQVGEKMSLVKEFKEWGFVVGTGVYVHEINKFAWEGVRTTIFLSLAVALLCVIVAWFMGRGISKEVLSVSSNFQDIASRIRRGEWKSRVDLQKLTPEFQIVGQNVNSIIDEMQRPVHECLEVLQKMSTGNLTSKMEGNYEGDSAKLKENLNSTLEALNDSIRQLGTTVSKVSDSGVKVSSTAQTLSQGATEQASSLEEISSTMSEIGGKVKVNAENAHQAQVISNDAKKAADSGNSNMKEMLVAMDGITKSSDDISKIIKVIDEIAFQTNLLALNAAVEAARAGKYGKGFAVVAEEVRNLAARSAKAAKETTELIETTSKKVNEGAAKTHVTAKSLEDIMVGAVKVSDLVSDIAVASRDQSESIAQVVSALSQIDSVTQKNTAGAEEAASAAQLLSGQARQLQSLVSRFQILRRPGEGVQAPKEAAREEMNIDAPQMKPVRTTSSDDAWGGESSKPTAASGKKRIEVVKWDNAYSVKVQQFDDEHKRLFELINDFYNGMELENSKFKTIELLKGLKDYTVYHFSNEEQKMKMHNYSGYDQQVKLHKAFVAKVDSYLQKVEKDEPIMSTEVVGFLKKWLVEHIQQIDSQYSEFFLNKGLARSK